MLEATEFAKQYGDVTALDVHELFFGPVAATSGRIAVCARDIATAGKAARSSLGIVPQEFTSW